MQNTSQGRALAQAKKTTPFHIPPQVVAEIRTRADQGEKTEPLFHVDVVDKDNQVIARVEKRLYVRTKNGKADR